MRWVPPRGAPGAATGATATGAAGISTSTTIIILIATITSTASKEVSFSTMRRIAETLLMGIGKQRTSLAARLAGRAAHAKGPVLLIAPEVEPEHAQAVAELELAPVVAELEHGPVAVELVVVPVEVALELVQAAGELELGQAAAVPVLGHPRARLVLPLGTKSVTTAHRPDLVPLLAGEDLVVAAETTREPVAAEAVIAWEVAG